jgi:hypothetical protein
MSRTCAARCRRRSIRTRFGRRWVAAWWATPRPIGSPPGVPGFEEAGGTAGPGVDFLAFREGNLALARRYLRQAGYAQGRIAGVPVLDIVARRQASAPAFAAETRRALAALGLRSRVRFLAFGRFIRAYSRDPSVAACLGYRWQRDLDDAREAEQREHFARAAQRVLDGTLT